MLTNIEYQTVEKSPLLYKDLKMGDFFRFPEDNRQTIHMKSSGSIRVTVTNGLFRSEVTSVDQEELLRTKVILLMCKLIVSEEIFNK